MAQENMTLQDWLDDLCVRFIINLPREDLSSVARICFQIEEAQWFYEDFIRPLDPSLPSMGLRSFSLKMFQHCPLLASFSTESHIRAFDEFIHYKQRVPVRGAIMLNDTMDSVVLVRGYKKGSRWSFPRGKINKDEDDLDCAIREVYEETGYDIREAGLVEKNEPLAPLQVTMRDQHIQLFVFRGIPEDTIFKTRTRKEIGDIRWYKVSELPAYRKRGVGKNNDADGLSNDKFHLVAPFMVQLRQWVLKQRKLDAKKVAESSSHHHPPVSYEDNLIDDKVIHGLIQASPPRGTNPDFIDSATKELQRLLKVKPPTQGLQIPSPASNHYAGQALMSLLQPRVAGDEQAPSQAQVVPHTFSEAPQPRSPHYHHAAQRVPASTYGALAPSLAEANPNTSHHQNRARPHVNVATEFPNPPVFSEQPHQPRSQPVQLVHPQPLPPQVQKAMLLRSMASSPQVADPSSNLPVPSGLPQENQHVAQDSQFFRGTQGVLHKKPTSPLPAHTANLLSVLKGGGVHPNAGQPLKPESSQQSVYMPVEHQNHQRYFPSPGNGFASQYGTSAMPSNFNTMALSNTQATLPNSDLRPILPTDKHRAGLLDMFKKTESSVSQNQLDGESTSRRSSRLGEVEGKRQWANPSPSAATALRAAAHENGRPMQMNPETNLPFGALSILSRSQASQSPKDNTTALARIPANTARYSATGSRPSRRSSFTKASPRPNQVPPQKAQRLVQLSPKDYSASTQSYPYGTTQGGGPNPLLLFPNPPSASALPVPGIVQFRQDSSVEHRNALLSLFGKPKSGFEQSKGKEPAMVDQFGPNAVPRSRLGSVASSEGVPGMRGSISRRESQAALSPADRNFLLNFLGNASGNARR
ncbi:mRNA-decapping enzyme subunit 2 [Parahypoxylon ruwenzoriense]